MHRSPSSEAEGRAGAGPRLLCIGDNVVDCYPDLGVMFPGGNAVNVAVHARRLGGWSGYLGVLGSDPAGDCVGAALAAEGVDTSNVRVIDGENARAVVRLVGGNRVFAEGHVGVSRFSLDAKGLAAAAAAAAVHTGECSMLEDDLPRLAQATRLLSFDFSERPWEYIAEHAPHVDVAIASATDDTDPIDLARRIARLGPATVAVTRGALGAVLLSHGSVVEAPAGPGPVLDTLGAGDAFIAHLLLGILNSQDPDHSPQELLTAATRYATATCADHGAFGHQMLLPDALGVPHSVTTLS